MQNLIKELKRRNVVKAGVLYGVCAWLTMQIVDVMFPALKLPEWSVTLFAALLVLLLPLVLVFSWVFEVTADGLKRTADVALMESTTGTGRRMDKIILATLTLTVGLVVYQLVTERRVATHDVAVSLPAEGFGSSATTALKSVAVLPFVNMSSDTANESFSDGISEELINALVRLKGLRVPSRTSSFAFKGLDTDVSEIGRALNVNHIVEGSVRKSGNRVRVTAQLIDLRTDSHLWSQTFDQQLDDIFAVQDEIARGIAKALEVQLGVGEGERLVAQTTSNMQAYELYLRAGQLWQLRRREAVVNAEALLLQAIELDPGFAEAWARLAAVNIVTSSWSEAELAEITEKAEMAAQRALQLDESLALPRAVLANIAAGRQDFSTSERLFLESIQLEPSDPTTHLWYAILLNGLGRLHAASLEYRLAVTLDPLAPIGLSWLAAHETQNGNHQNALDAALRAAELGYAYGHIVAYQALVRLGDLKRAETELRLGLQHDAFDSAFVDALIQAQREPDQRGPAIKMVSAQLSLPDQIYTFADLRAYDSMLDAFSNLRGTLLYLSMPALWDKASPGLRRDARFRSLAERLRLVDYWRSSGLWPDYCSPAGDSFDCDTAVLPHP